MSISLTAIDAGFAADDVLAYCRHHSTFKVIAVRGIAGDAAPRIARVQRERDEKRGTVLRYSRRFYNVGANTLKWSLYKDLAKDDPTAPGYISFPTGLPDSYFQELVSEQRVAHKRLGVTVWRWEKPERQPNEMLDTMIYATAAALKHGVNWISDLGWKKLREEIETYPPIDDKPSPKRTSLVSTRKVRAPWSSVTELIICELSSHLIAAAILKGCLAESRRSDSRWSGELASIPISKNWSVPPSTKLSIFSQTASIHIPSFSRRNCFGR
jgi:phage terminase large subunit GpA-like protein